MLTEKFAGWSWPSRRATPVDTPATSETSKVQPRPRSISRKKVLGDYDGSRSEGLSSRGTSLTKRDRDGISVQVSVRCRPPANPKEPTFTIAGDTLGRPKIGRAKSEVTLKLDIPETANGGRKGSEDLLRQRGTQRYRCNAYFGPEATQKDVFEAAAPIVDWTMEGYNSTIFCYVVTGTGKTYTMMGPPEDVNKPQPPNDETGGVVQRVARRIFEYIRDRSAHGEVFVVEAQFLEIYNSDGKHEQLIDLLSDEERLLEVKQDPLNTQAFVCDGLRRVPIRSPDEMCEVLRTGQRRCHVMETTKNCHSSRSHCLFMLSIESLSEISSSGEPMVQRGKLTLVDLAGSESIMRVQASDAATEELRKRQAMGINRVLSALATVVSNMSVGVRDGHSDSTLTMLLRDCLGGNARALLVATIGPELENLEETIKTLTFAQQMMTVKNVATVNNVSEDKSSLIQMRQRHADFIRVLQEKVSEKEEEEMQERQQLEKEMSNLNAQLLTKESAEKTLEVMRAEQSKKMDELKDEVSQVMSKELAEIRKWQQQDLVKLKQSVESQVSTLDSSHSQRFVKEHEDRIQTLQDQVKEALSSQKTAEDESAKLRVQCALAEERTKMLQQRQEELRKERGDFDEERKGLRQQNEQQWQKLTAAEGELQRHKAEAQVSRTELARVNKVREEDRDNWQRERDTWRTAENDYQREVAELKRKLEEARRDAQSQAFEQREVVSQLRSQLEKKESEVAAITEKLSQEELARSKLEVDIKTIEQREETYKQSAARDMRQCQEQLQDARVRETELMHMLQEVQDSIITASASGVNPDLQALVPHDAM